MIFEEKKKKKEAITPIVSQSYFENFTKPDHLLGIKLKNKNKILNDFIDSKTLLEYKKFNPVFLNYEKFYSTIFTEYFASLHEDKLYFSSRSEKITITKNVKKKKIKKNNKEADIDLKVSCRKIKKFDEQTKTKLYVEWSGENVLPELINDCYSEQNNVIMDKIINFDIIIWQTG